MNSRTILAFILGAIAGAAISLATGRSVRDPGHLEQLAQFGSTTLPILQDGNGGLWSISHGNGKVTLVPIER